MKNIKLLLAFLLVSLLMGCLHSDEDSKKSDLDRNISIWKKANITDYQYRFSQSCFCPPEEDIVIVVKAAVISEAFYVPSGIYLADIELGRLHTIPNLFDIVQEAIDSNVASLKVTYNDNYGYPEVIEIDRIKAAIDDEVTYYATEFQ